MTQPLPAPTSPPTSSLDRLFVRSAVGRLAASSAEARTELEAFATCLRSIVGPQIAQLSIWPYRHEGIPYWSFDVDGCAESVSLTFIESGRTRLPLEAPYDGTGSVADSVDAHYLFMFLKRELAGEDLAG